MDILTHIIYQYFRPRQQAIGRFAEDAGQIQFEQLMHLVRKAERTAWGRKYDYRSIRTYADFAGRFPVQTYDRVKGEIK